MTSEHRIRPTCGVTENELHSPEDTQCQVCKLSINATLIEDVHAENSCDLVLELSKYSGPFKPSDLFLSGGRHVRFGRGKNYKKLRGRTCRHDWLKCSATCSQVHVSVYDLSVIDFVDIREVILSLRWEVATASNQVILPFCSDVSAASNQVILLFCFEVSAAPDQTHSVDHWF